MTSTARIGERAGYLEEESHVSSMTRLGLAKAGIDVGRSALELIEDALDADGADRCPAGMHENGDRTDRAVRR